MKIMENYLKTKHRFFPKPQGPPANVWHPLHLSLRARGDYLPVPQSGRKTIHGKGKEQQNTS